VVLPLLSLSSCSSLSLLPPLLVFLSLSFSLSLSLALCSLILFPSHPTSISLSLSSPPPLLFFISLFISLLCLSTHSPFYVFLKTLIHSFTICPSISPPFCILVCLSFSVSFSSFTHS